HLEHADPGAGRPAGQRLVDLDDLGTQRAGVVRVGVEVGDLGVDVALPRLDRVVLGGLGQSRAVLGVDDVAVQVTDPQPHDNAGGDRAVGDRVQPAQRDCVDP